MSEKPLLFVDTVFHVMTKVSYFVYFVKVPLQPRSQVPPWLFFWKYPSTDITYKSSPNLEIPARAQHSVLWNYLVVTKYAPIH